MHRLQKFYKFAVYRLSHLINGFSTREIRSCEYSKACCRSGMDVAVNVSDLSDSVSLPILLFADGIVEPKVFFFRTRGVGTGLFLFV